MRALVVGLCVATIVGSGTAHAFPMHRRLAQHHYGAKVPCDLCHGYGGGTERNAFGKQWHGAGENLKAFKKIDSIDSDGDGFTNGDEVKGNSNPGDPGSVPDNPGRYAKLKERIFVPTEQLELVMEGVQRIDVLEPDVTEKQLRKISRRVGLYVDEGVRFPTLYFGIRNGERKEVAMFTDTSLGRQHFSMLLGIGTDGRIKKVVMFRAGDDTGARYRPYLNCFLGRSKSELGPDGPDCRPARGISRRVRRALTRSILQSLWTLAVLFGGEN